MNRRKSVADLVYEACQLRIEALGLELVDVEMATENKSKILRVYIDKPGGVSIDDCTEVSHLIDPIIDDELQIKTHDYFEVSSPGLERPLKTDRDYERYKGEWVLVTLYKAVEGNKKFTGTLGPVTPETITIVDEDGKTLSFKREQVAKARRELR